MRSLVIISIAIDLRVHNYTVFILYMYLMDFPLEHTIAAMIVPPALPETQSTLSAVKGFHHPWFAKSWRRPNLSPSNSYYSTKILQAKLCKIIHPLLKATLNQLNTNYSLFLLFLHKRKETSPLDSSFLAMTTSTHSLRMFYGAREEV